MLRDGLLAFRGDQPVDERLAQLLLHMGMLVRADQHDAILVEQPLVSLNGNVELAAVLERQPCATVGQHIAVHGGRRVERRAHALPDLAIPRALVSAGDIDGGRPPQRKLRRMGAGLVAARHERRGLVPDRGQCGDDVLAALDAGRIAVRANQDEVVIHHREALHAKAVGDEFLLLRPGVHEHDVGIAAPAGIERLPRALRDHLHANASLGLEQRQDVIEQAGVLGGCGRRHNDRFFLGKRGRGEGQKDREKENASVHAEFPCLGRDRANLCHKWTNPQGGNGALPKNIA